MQGQAMWQILTFLLNSFLFVLIGLQLPQLLDELRATGDDSATVIGYGLAVSAVVVLVRIVYAFVLKAVPGFSFGPRPDPDSKPNTGNVALVAWMGMRGAVSLAAALALPTVTDAGEPFRERPLILVVTFIVILVTLVVQGLSLPLVARAVRAQPDDDGAGYEENIARKLAARAALERLDALADEDWVREDTVERMRGMYRYRYNRFAARFDEERDGDAIEARTANYLRMVASVLEAQRGALEELRRAGRISDDVMRRVERELDLEEGRFLEQ
jgi:CPA1 family monovalent cation:H+ antiporter